MSLTLVDFLCSNPVEGETEEVIISERLKDFKFTIGTMTKAEQERYSKQCTKRAKSGKVLDQNAKLFSELIVLNHCLYPKFNDVEFVQQAGCATPSEALYKVLKIGEVDTLAKKIMEFNGYAEEYEEIQEQAKN